VFCSPKSLSWQMEVSYLIALLLAYFSEYACSSIYGASSVLKLPPSYCLVPRAWRRSRRGTNLLAPRFTCMYTQTPPMPSASQSSPILSLATSTTRTVKTRQRGSTSIPVRKDVPWRTRLARATFAIIVLGTLFSIPILILVSFSRQFTVDEPLES